MAGMELDSLETIAERRMKDKIKAILENPSHPLHKEQRQIGITFSLHILPPRCQTERFRLCSHCYQTVQQQWKLQSVISLITPSHPEQTDIPTAPVKVRTLTLSQTTVYTILYPGVYISCCYQFTP